MKRKLFFLGVLCMNSVQVYTMDSSNPYVRQLSSLIEDTQHYFLRAVANKNYADIQLLLEEGNDINATYELKVRESGYIFKRRPLQRALNYGYYDVAKFLIDQGADVTYEDEYGKATPLHDAALSDDVALIDLLLKKGAKIDAQDIVGNTASHVCLTYFNNHTHYYPVLLYLITKGADIVIPNSLKFTVLYRIKACPHLTNTQKKELLCEALKLAKRKGNYEKEKLKDLEEAYAVY